MLDIANQFVVVAGLLFGMFTGPAIAATLLFLRKRLRRARRRSPIGIDLLRSAGHTVREQLDEAFIDMYGDILMLSVMPLFVIALCLAQIQFRGWEKTAGLVPLYLLFGGALVVRLTVKVVRAGERLETLRSGYDAELAAGQALDSLMREGAYVFHDFPADGFNINHVVIARQGLFAIETKGYSKSALLKGRASATVRYDGKTLEFPTWQTAEPMEQADRQGRWLETWAGNATGISGLKSIPVVALPGWFVERPSAFSGVAVVGGGELFRLLQGHPARLSAERVGRLAHQVEQRCRTVVPTLRRKPA